MTAKLVDHGSGGLPHVVRVLRCGFVALGYPDRTLKLLSPDGTSQILAFDYDIIDIASAPAQVAMLAIAFPTSVQIRSSKRSYMLDDILAPNDGRLTRVLLTQVNEKIQCVASDERGNLHRISFGSRPRHTVKRTHRKSIHTLTDGRLCPDGQPCIVSASDDRDVQVHHAITGKPIRVLPNHAGWVEQAVVAGSQDTIEYVATVDRVGLAIWRVSDGSLMIRRKARVTTDIVTAWSQTRNEPLIAAGTDDHGVLLCSPTSVQTLTLPGRVLHAVALLNKPSCGDLLCAAIDNSTWYWDGQTWHQRSPRFPSSVFDVRSWPVGHASSLVILEDGSVLVVEQ